MKGICDHEEEQRLTDLRLGNRAFAVQFENVSFGSGEVAKRVEAVRSVGKRCEGNQLGRYFLRCGCLVMQQAEKVGRHGEEGEEEA